MRAMNHAHENLQRQGRACYKRKDYKRALEFFDWAIGRAPSVQLLDNRAACHEKLNDLPAALKDAKKAIQLQREDPTGYLRAGKVLLRMEKQSVGLEIYSHGLKSVKHVGQGYQLLRKAHDELLCQLSPTESVDPLTVLPRELAEIIIEYLNFKQRMNACLVSKEWATFIRSMPKFWRHLDLSETKRKVRNAFISRAINTGRQRLSVATLNNLYDFEKALSAIIRHCPLQELTLLDTGFHSQDLIDMLKGARNLKILRLGQGTEIGPTTLRLLMDSLEVLECRIAGGVQFPSTGNVCNNLKAIKLVRTEPGDWTPILRSISTGMPSLQSLTIHDLGSWALPRISGPVDLSNLATLQHLDLRGVISRADQLRLPFTLTQLSLVAASSASRPFFGISLVPQIKTTFNLPRLEQLSLDVPNMSNGDVVHFLDDVSTADQQDIAGGARRSDNDPAAAPSNLQTLSIRSAAQDTSCLSTLVSHPRLQDVKHLALRPQLCLIEHWTSEIAAKFQRLESVDFSETDITGVGVKELIQKGHVKHLVLNDCRKLGRDAIDWARSQGARVEYRMTKVGNGGKKVRY